MRPEKCNFSHKLYSTSTTHAFSLLPSKSDLENYTFFLFWALDQGVTSQIRCTWRHVFQYSQLLNVISFARIMKGQFSLFFRDFE